MSNTSKKRRNNRLWTGGIIAVVALLVVSFFVSNKEEPIDPASFAEVEIQEDSAHIKGNPDAEFVLVEYSDLQCPACKATAPILTQLVADFPEKVAIEYRHFPLRTIHPNAQAAAEAAEAASIQGKFWEMHDKLFETQGQAGSWTQSFSPKKHFVEYAEELGLNVDRFRFDLESDEVKDRVNADANEAAELQIPGTPGFVLDGEVIDLGQFVAENLQVLPTEEPSL